VFRLHQTVFRSTGVSMLAPLLLIYRPGFMQAVGVQAAGTLLAAGRTGLLGRWR
jgi:hypothetical protein